MTVLVTGVAGFIGFHVARVLLDRGDSVVGIDNLNDYYDVSLKQARLDRLTGADGFHFARLDISDRTAVAGLIERRPEIDRVVHMAAQAGVRHSLVDPYVYVTSNVEGHVVLLEACRRLPVLRHFVYASSSSVYGGNRKLPFSVEDRVDTPLSLYAATKKAMEEISHAYAHVYAMPVTGLRFFTVYGPWGRPDMAAFIFARKIVAREPIPVFNDGDMRRDFTYIDDIVDGVVACLDRPPGSEGSGDRRHADANGRLPWRVYNLGNHRSEHLRDYIAAIEDALGLKAELELLPMQPGDVKETFADIEASRRDFGFEPKTPIDVGIPRFITWFREFYCL